MHYKKRKLLVVLCVNLVLIGCSGTPYKPYDAVPPAGGYTDKKLGDNLYEVRFHGNGNSKIETVVEYWNRRALELCPHGFVILKKDETVSKTKTPDTVSVQMENAAPVVSYQDGYPMEIPDVQGVIECK